MVQKIIKYCIGFLVVLIVIILSIDTWVNAYGKYCYDDISAAPYRKVGVVLGTSKYIKKGVKNRFYQYRIDAAVKAFKANKISYLLVSGDNSTQYYNEPITFQKDLIEAGIPDSVIYLDYAGLRTFDSMIRSNKIFGLDDFMVISQAFHNQRAVFIARNNGLDVVGYNAQEVKNGAFWVNVREKLARVKMVLDLYFLNTSAKYLGDPIPIPSSKDSLSLNSDV